MQFGTECPSLKKHYICSVMKIRLLYILCLLTLSVVSCTPSAGYKTIDGEMLGTTFHIVANTRLDASAIYSKVMEIDARAKASMSIFDENSLINRINRSETDSLDEHLKRNIEIAARVNAISDGMYDITVKPLTDAYGFARKNKTEHPNVDSIMEFVGFSKFRIDGNRIVKSDPRVQIDLNSIAKGYTVDLISDWLEAEDVRDYIVEVGGEIRALGVNPKGINWRVGVDSPFDGNNTPGAYQQSVVSLSGCALATSGNYRRFYNTERGEKITHTINPKSGYSINSRLLSVTVLAPTCALADALATMFMALGDGPAQMKAEQMKDQVQVYMILSQNEPGEEFEIFSTIQVSQVKKGTAN